MVEYSLAKAEVEGSSPFFRLGFFYPVFSPKNIFLCCCLRHQKRVANKSGGHFVAWQIWIICHDSGRRCCLALRWPFPCKTQLNRCCAHIIRITNDGAGNNREDGEIKRYGESLEAQCFPANLQILFFIAPREKLRSVALLEFSLESNSGLWIMQLLSYAELIKILFIYQTYNLQT